jgi:hypothetical protein
VCAGKGLLRHRHGWDALQLSGVCDPIGQETDGPIVAALSQALVLACFQTFACSGGDRKCVGRRPAILMPHARVHSTAGGALCLCLAAER